MLCGSPIFNLESVHGTTTLLKKSHAALLQGHGKFQPADVGQAELYLRWPDKHERQPNEQPPIGLILCSEKNRQRIELFELEQRGVRVAEYLTESLPRPVLEAKLNEAIKLARETARDSN